MKMNLVKCKNSISLTEYCLKTVTDIKNNDETSQVIIIVPEQFSYAAEKLITGHFGGSGLNGIEVLTFSRLTSKFVNRAKKNYLSASGKTMLIQNAIYKACLDEDNIYSGCIDKPGLAGEMQGIISEFERYMITPEILSDTANEMKDGILKNKLLSLAQIYSAYLDNTQNRFYDAEEDLSQLAQIILEKHILKDVSVIFYEFSDFLPRHYKVIEAMVKTAGEVYITLPDDKYNPDLMKIPQNTEKRLVSIASKNKIKTEIIVYESGKSQFNSPEIEFYHKNYTKFNNKSFVPYEKETKDISIFAAKDPFSEISHMARQIKTLTQKENYRYSDIAVVFGSSDDYNHIIQSVFNDYQIPYFTDTKMPITAHPAAIAALGVFDIIESGWSYDSVFAYLKSGFIYENSDKGIKEISRDDIDLLEAYVLKKGIRGKKKWLLKEDWIYDNRSLSDIDYKSSAKYDEYTRRINAVRNKIIEPIKTFTDKISGRKTVRELSEAYYDFLRDIYLYEGLKKEIKILDDKGLRNQAEQFSLLWNMLIEVINQSVVTLGDEKCSKKDFCNYLFQGLSTCSIGIIPSSLDSVTVGTADSVRQKPVKALFVAGSIRGVIPMEMTNEGILADKERAQLKEIFANTDIEIGQDTKELKNASEYRFYRVLFMARDRIFISYPVNNSEGEALVPAQFVFEMNKIFKNILKHDDLLSEGSFDDLLYSPSDAFSYLLENRKIKDNSVVKDLYNWFSNNPLWRDKLRIINTADRYKSTPLKISEENAKKLYENLSSYSVSRLNEFSSCPFKYFLKYGLRAKEQEVWKIQKFDLGSLMHLAICRFCRTVENGAKNFDELKENWNALTKERCEELIDTVMTEILTSIILCIDKDESKIKYLMGRMSKVIKRAVETIRISIKNGEYVAAEHEKSFRVNLSQDGESISVNGTIDRIDIAKTEDNLAKLRIIDYKSGKKDFSVVSIANMLDVQLIVYAACAEQLYNRGEIRYSEGTTSAQVCGIMYNKIRDDMKKINPEQLKEVDKHLNDIMMLNGVVILDRGDDEEFDLTNALMMDNDLSKNGKSEFLNIKLKNDGSPAKTSEISSRDDFNKLIEYVEKNIINIDKKIKAGDIEIRPYSNNNSLACAYCDMAEICLFDEEKDDVRPVCTSEEEAWNIINKD